MMEKKTNRLVSNIKYYSLGVLSSKLVAFIFIPIYAAFIRPESLGTYQYLYSIVSLVVPIVYQSVWEGMFRFSIVTIGKELDVINTTTKYVIGLSLVYSLLFYFATCVLKFEYSGYLLGCGISNAVISYWQYAARALKANREYATASILSAAVTLLSSIILIVCLKWQIRALFISNIVGTFSAAIYLEAKLRLINKCTTGRFDKELLFSILKYSIPLAINSISWWLVSSCNNIVVTKILGEHSNGIMAMAQRFGSIFALVTSIISMAWQEESFRTCYDTDRDAYFNKVLNIYIKSLFSSVLVLTPVTYLLYMFMVQGDYLNGVSLTSILYIIAAYNAIVTHLGSAFLTEGKSNILFWTTFIAGLLTLVFSIILIHPFGLEGVLWATMLSCLINMFIRVRILKKKMSIKINYIQLVILTIMCFAMTYICKSLGLNVIAQFIVLVVSCCGCILYNKQLIEGFIKNVKH